MELEKNKKYIGTLHLIPKDKFRSRLLRRFSKRFLYIIVHSEFLKDELDKIGINNVKVIDYPSFINIDTLSSLEAMERKEIIISCLGGTRNDKGLFYGGIIYFILLITLCIEIINKVKKNNRSKVVKYIFFTMFFNSLLESFAPFGPGTSYLLYWFILLKDNEEVI